MLKKQTLVLFVLLFLMASNNLKAEVQTFDLSSIDGIEISEDSDADVHDLVRALPENVDNAKAIRELVVQALDLVEANQDISEYDYLWILYSLLRNSFPGIDGGLSEQDYVAVADVAIEYLDSNGVGQWVFTDQGQFKMEVYRIAGNGAAWLLRKSEPEKAFDYIEQALGYARDEDTYLQDTYVRVLLNLGRKDEAYTIVKELLEQDPKFHDFQDFLTNDDYRRWLNRDDQ